MLSHCGKTLLEGIIRDFQAREFLHFTVFGKQCMTPVAIMTSSVRNNLSIFRHFVRNMDGLGGDSRNFVLLSSRWCQLLQLKILAGRIHCQYKHFYDDLRAVETIGASKCRSCLPGMVLNKKKPVTYVDHFGIQHSISASRLECTMQNIADNLLNTYASGCNKGIESLLGTFILQNGRKRVTSSARRKRKMINKSLHQTTDGSFSGCQWNASNLLSQCNIKIYKITDNSKYLDSGPPFISLLHPELGPL